ncbi:MAG: hypothetical protein F6J86_42400 [Symploca sp. SIO1B1]|nr:hypothetical protein [Symploca sp. SIO1C2]NES00370.1 hypothetical protein [Symploca sp. SIO1B1]
MLVAHLLQQPDQEKAISNYQLTEEQKRREQWDWIWEPFETFTNSNVTTIAGRVAYLISQTQRRGGVNRLLDPRIVVPICLIQSQDQRQVGLLEKFRQECQTQTKVSIRELTKIVQEDTSDEQIKQLLQGVRAYSRWIESLLGELVFTYWGYLFLRVPPSYQIQILCDIFACGTMTKQDYQNYSKYINDNKYNSIAILSSSNNIGELLEKTIATSEEWNDMKKKVNTKRRLIAIDEEWEKWIQQR